MLTVKPVYKLLNVSDDLKWTTNTHVTPFSLPFKAYVVVPDPTSPGFDRYRRSPRFDPGQDSPLILT